MGSGGSSSGKGGGGGGWTHPMLSGQQGQQGQQAGYDRGDARGTGDATINTAGLTPNYTEGAFNRAVGTGLGALAGTAFGGPVSGLMTGAAVNSSMSDGWLGDITNSRNMEHERDVLESQGISRNDTALAMKHGILGSVLDDDDDDIGAGWDEGVLNT